MGHPVPSRMLVGSVVSPCAFTHFRWVILCHPVLSRNSGGYSLRTNSHSPPPLESRRIVGLRLGTDLHKSGRRIRRTRASLRASARQFATIRLLDLCLLEKPLCDKTWCVDNRTAVTIPCKMTAESSTICGKPRKRPSSSLSLTTTASGINLFVTSSTTPQEAKCLMLSLCPAPQ